MTFYLGRADGLVALPPPDRGIEPTAARLSTVHQGSSGARVVDLAPRLSRTYRMSWSWLGPDDFAVLEQFHQGARGPGPFVLLDPGRRNHLASNQASATSHRGDASGFSVAPGSDEALSSTTALVDRGPRALCWSLPGTVTAGVLDLDPPAGLLGFPLPAAQPWTLSGTVRLGGVLSTVTVTPALSWRRADGSETTVTTGAPVAAVPGTWTAWSVSLATPPAGAVYVRPQLRVAAGVLTAAGTQPSSTGQAAPARRVRAGTAVRSRSTAVLVTPPRYLKPGRVIIVAAPTPLVQLFVDKLQLDMSATARTWAMGTGIPQVSMTALGEEYRLLPSRNAAATFIEVGI